MTTVTPEAEKFISELLEKNKKKGFGVKIYLAGMSCSGPQFGMTFQEKAAEGDKSLKCNGFDFFFDDETGKALEPCVIEFVDDPNFGTGLIIRDPTASCSCGDGCGSGCGGGCGGGCH